MSFLRNAAILSIGGIVVRTLGAVYRIPLARLIGDEGMGLYQMAYPIYSMLLAVSLTGPPIAVAKMVAERVAQRDYRSAHRVFQLALALLSIVGLVTTITLLLTAQRFASALGDPRSFYALLAMVPAIFFVSIMSAFRGYFQGLQDMLPYAMSQVVEQVARVAVALGLGVYLLRSGYALELVAGGVSLGVTIGSIGGLSVLLVDYFKRKAIISGRIRLSPIIHREHTSKLIKEMLDLAVPITIGGLVVSLMLLIDAAVVPRRLQVAGFSQEQATALYGQLSGMASPLVNLPQMVTVALVASLVPSIAEAISLRRRQLVNERANLALKVAMLWNFPAAVGLSVMATPIVVLLYGQNAVGVGIPLAVLGYMVAFLAIQQTTTGILQGLGQAHLPVFSIAAGALVKLVLSYVLTAMPALNIRGAATATVLAFMVSSGLNLVALHTWGKLKIDWGGVFLRPAIAAVGMGMAVFYSRPAVTGFIAHPTLATLVSLVIGGLSYGVLAVFVGAIKVSELQDLPVVGHLLGKVFFR
ncbi:MAG: polysaccharide biosynthesis protein [Bacillota bacterium]|nr:polysaccharide biosynthesis protein [Bacillota bacterium]